MMVHGVYRLMPIGGVFHDPRRPDRATSLASVGRRHRNSALPVAVPVRGPTSDGQRSMPVLVTGPFIVPAPVFRNMERPRPIGRGRSMGFASWSDETEQRGEHGGESEQGDEGERHAELHMR